MKESNLFIQIISLSIFLLASIAPQQAVALELKLEASSGTVLVIDDNSVLDSSPITGLIGYSGPVDDFTVVVNGLSKPVVGNSTKAELSLDGIVIAGESGGSMTISVTDTDYSSGSGTTVITSAVGGNADSFPQFQVYLDIDNAAFGTSPSTCTTGLQGPFNNSPFADTATATCDVDDRFSMTIVKSAIFGPNTFSSFSDHVNVKLLEEPLACRFTGGGVDTDLNWDHTLESGEMIKNGAGNLPTGIDRYQFGGQVGARTATQPQPSGEWQHHQQTGPTGAFSFHGGTSSAADGTRIVEVRCSDPGFCFPARPAPAKQLDFDGIGTFSNLGKGKSEPVFYIENPNVIAEPSGKKEKLFTFHWFEVNIDDLGEPGRRNIGAPNSMACPGRGFGEKSDGVFMPDPVNNPANVVILPLTELANCECPDFYRITIYKGVLSTEVAYLEDGRIDPASLDKSNVIYESFGYIDGGNLQIHPPTGFDSK